MAGDCILWYLNFLKEKSSIPLIGFFLPFDLILINIKEHFTDLHDTTDKLSIFKILRMVN